MEGIVVSKIRYNDHSMIVNIISSKHGKKAYLKRFSKRNKDYLILEPFHLVDFKTSKKGSNKWEVIKECSLLYQYPKTHLFEINSFRFFLSEFLNLTIQNEEENPQLFEFLKRTIHCFSEDLNTHILVDFLYNISAFKGLYVPNEKRNYFDLIESEYCDIKPLHNSYIDESELRSIYEYSQNGALEPKIHKTLFKALLKFYTYHFESLNRMKSLDIIKEVLS